MQTEQSTRRVICEVCSDAPPKYKCPSCRLKYCSVACFKAHKGDRSCERLTNKNKEEEGKSLHKKQITGEQEDGEICDSGSDDEDSVNPQVLEKLEHSITLKSLLQNKHLQEMIKNIDSSQTPEKCLQEGMQVPIFTEFVDVCLGLVEPEQAKEQS